jgi:hypothetical protein
VVGKVLPRSELKRYYPIVPRSELKGIANCQTSHISSSESRSRRGTRSRLRNHAHPTVALDLDERLVEEHQMFFHCIHYVFSGVVRVD